MEHVYWVTSKLAGRCGPAEHQWDLQELRKEGFTTIVSLDNQVDAREIIKAGFTHVPLYLPDVALITQDLKDAFVEAAVQFVSIVTSEKGPILVHCFAGNDRTGAMLACFLISTGISTEEALAEVRKHNPNAMVTPGYEDAVRLYASRQL